MAAPTPQLNYEVPEWSSPPPDKVVLEQIKNGVALEDFDLSGKPFFVVGRLPECDIPLEHQSVSRHHAIIQHKGDGTTYIYDLGSTHGTRVNKKVVPARTYQQLYNNDFIKFGESTRTFIFQSASAVMAPPALPRSAGSTVAKDSPNPTPNIAEKLQQVTWGMDDDAIDEEAGEGLAAKGVQPLTAEQMAKIEKQFTGDPKKSLRNWMEQRNLDFSFQVSEEGPGHARIYTATIDVTHNGDIKGTGTAGKRKEAEREACLDALKKLAAFGLLDGPAAIARREKRDLDSDSDDDDFYDRTGKTKSSKNDKKQKVEPTVETYDSLLAKQSKMKVEIQHLENVEIKSLEGDANGKGKSRNNDSEINDEEDELAGVLSNLKDSERKAQALKAKQRLEDLRKELAKVEKLIKIAKPVEF